MMTETDRMARAGHYVSGLMSETERERAELDLERDSSFRDAVVTVSQRMRAIDGVPSLDRNSDELWAEIAARLAELPQLRNVLPFEQPSRRPEIIVNKPIRTISLDVLGGPHQRRVAALAACFCLIFAAGFFIGLRSTGSPQALAQVDLQQPAK